MRMRATGLVPESRFWLVLGILTVLMAIGLPAGAQGPGGGPGSDGAQEAEYRIGPEDVLQLQVWGRPDLSGAVEVSQRGGIQVPIVGHVPAAGRTPVELGRDLTDRLRVFDPAVSEAIVTVVQHNALTVSVVGAVTNPGRYGFKAMPDLWEALLAAGGAAPNADLSRVQVVRKETEEGEDRSTLVDLSRGIDDTDAATLPTLRSKDTIVVPTLEEGVGSSERIRVLGAVRAPGIYRLGLAGSLVEALSVSGGTLENANLAEVHVTRLVGDRPISYRVDLEDYLTDAGAAADLQLRAGDTILVPRRDSIGAQIMTGLLRIAPLVTVVTGLVAAVNR